MSLASLRKLVRPAAALVALAVSGCLKMDQTITVFPDGSGKIQMKTALLGMMGQMAKMGGQMGGPNGGGGGARDPFDMIKKDFGGNVTWANLKAEDGPDGSYVLSGTGYFDDINKVQRKDGSISWKKLSAGDEQGGDAKEDPKTVERDGYVFEMASSDDLGKKLSGNPFGGEGGDDKGTPEEQAQKKQMQEMMKGMLAGFEVKLKVVMPGAVKSAPENMKVDGRNASYALTDKDLFEIMDKKAKPPTNVRVVCGAPDKSLDDELAAFKKEFADARTAAEKEKAEKAAKEAERKKKQEGGEAGAPKGEGKEGGDGSKDGGEKKPEKPKEGKKPSDF